MPEQQSVSLYEQEFTVVNRLAKSKGLSFSAALRVIVNEWNDLVGSQRVMITEKGQQALEDCKESSTTD